MNNIPTIGQTYNCFDDGKISKCRLYTVDVKEIIPFDEIDNEILTIWENKKKESSHLFSETTDFFIKTENGENGEDAIFVRTKDNGWFSIGDYFNSGRLDVDGSLTEIMNRNE